MTPATGSEEMALVAVRSPVGLVAAALCEVEAAIVERDVALRFQSSTQVAPLERRAAATACVVLDSAIDHLDGEVELLQEHLDRTDAAGPPGGGLQRAHAAAQLAADEGVISLPTNAAPAPFLVVEAKLLALAGLAEALAERHVRGALEAFRRQDWSYDLSTYTYHQAVMTRLERGRDAVCTYAETLEAQEEEAAGALAARRRMRRMAQVLGGVLITGVNTATGLMLGPVAAAASSVIGAAGTSVVDIATDTDRP